MIKIDFLNTYVESSLKFLIFIYILNSFLYLFINNSVYSYIYAPINLFGAYFIFLLLKKDDIITFDEFSVPMHEFKAFHEFTSNFYIKLKPVAAVNNFYQTAFVVE